VDLAARARELFAGLQAEICGALEALEARARFGDDPWPGGRTRVLAGGQLFEKAGVTLADLEGQLGERIAERLAVPAQGFYATGLSVVVHPLSPMVPTVHMNLRFLKLADGTAWFGGGADLTPYYLFEDDAAHFHATWRTVCESHRPGSYAEYKKSCDTYFRLTHRDEARGIGGIFFDNLRQDHERTFAFVEAVGRAFLEAYLPIVERRRSLPWWDRERCWQLERRGRYVEFNLIHDRGTLFGLETGGRTESILMSLPPSVRWTYDRHPEPGSPEARLLDALRSPRAW
jgi:coproporphyrinogen III oxidase